MDDWHVPADRSADRHDPDIKGRLIRPKPPDLWDRLGRLVGVRRRNEVISDLIARYLDGRPMPPLPDQPGAEPAPLPAEPATSDAAIPPLAGRTGSRLPSRPAPKPSRKGRRS